MLWDDFSLEWETLASGWSGQEFSVRAKALADEICSEGAVPGSLRQRAANGSDQALIVAAAIDLALGEVHPAWRTREGTDIFGRIVGRYERHGWLHNPEVTEGALLWRFSEPAPDAVAASYFRSVTRIPDALWRRMKLVKPSTYHDLPVAPPDIVVGCVPSAVSLSQFLFQTPRVGTYSVAPGSELSDPDHIASVLRSLDNSGAVVGILPECALDDDALASWQKATQDMLPPREGALHWILIGTGPVGGGTDREPPPNRAVLLSRRKGQIVCAQDKRFGFQIMPWHLDQWQLVQFLGPDGPLDEYITQGNRLTLIESLRSRYVILVCEDLSRGRETEGKDIDELVIASAPSFLFVPVFDRELNKERWVGSHSEDWARQIGAHTVVSNSAAVASARRDTGTIQDTELQHSAAFWWLDGRFESDFVGRDGGGAGGAQVTLYEVPKPPSS